MMRRCREVGQVVRRWPSMVRGYSEYAPAAPSPSDLKAPLPEKFSVGKNLKLKAILFQYDFLAGSNIRQSGPNSTSPDTISPKVAGNDTTKFQPLTRSGEQLVDEITGLLGGNRLQGMGRKLMADLKVKMGGAGDTLSTPSSPAREVPQNHRQHPQHQQFTGARDSDPKARYMEKLRKKTGGGDTSRSLGPATSQPGGDADLFAARNLVSSTEVTKLQSAWMLKQGAGDLLSYLATRSVRLGVIAGPRTTPEEFDNFVKQLRQQSIRVVAAVSPEVTGLDGVAAGVVRAGKELGVTGEGAGERGLEVLVVGSSEPLLNAATAAKMYTARYRPPNSRPEGVIQNFTVRDIDEVRTVVEQVNGVSFRS